MGMAGGLINRAPGYYGDELHRKSVIPAQLFRRSLFPPLPNHHIRLIGENKWDFFVPGCITPLNRSIQLCTFIWGHQWLPALDQGEEPQSPCMQLMSSGPCFYWETLLGPAPPPPESSSDHSSFFFWGLFPASSWGQGSCTLRAGALLPSCLLPAALPPDQPLQEDQQPCSLQCAEGEASGEAQNTAQGWKSTGYGVFFPQFLQKDCKRRLCILVHTEILSSLPKLQAGAKLKTKDKMPFDVFLFSFKKLGVVGKKGHVKAVSSMTETG